MPTRCWHSTRARHMEGAKVSDEIIQDPTVRHFSNPYVYGQQVTDTGIHATIERITPEIAEEMLRHNTHNRHLSSSIKNNRGNIFKSMECNEWRLTGESIKFAKDGTLLDGQHRLSACVTTGNPFTTVIVRGLEIDSQELMDSGRKRSTSDVLSIDGIKNARTVAAASVVIINYAMSESYSFSDNSVQYFSRERQLKFIRDNAVELETAVNRTRKCQSVPFAQSTMSGLAFLFGRISDVDTGWFFREFANISPTYQQVAMLRQSFINMRLKTGKNADKQITAAYAIKAWNAYMNGDDINGLSWRKGGAHPEHFPKIYGMTNEIYSSLI